MRNFNSNNWVRWIAGVLTFTLLSTTADPLFAQELQEDRCATLLKEAQDNYDGNLLDEAINLAKACVNQGTATVEHKVAAHKLLARIYQKKKDEKKAKEQINKILDAKPDWLPHAVNDPPSFVELAKVVLEEKEKAKETTPPTKKPDGDGFPWKIVAIGGGALAAGLVTAVLATGGKKDRPLAKPPPLP